MVGTKLGMKGNNHLKKNKDELIDLDWDTFMMMFAHQQLVLGVCLLVVLGGVLIPLLILARYAGQLDEELVWLEESPPLALDTLYLDASSLND